MKSRGYLVFIFLSLGSVYFLNKKNIKNDVNTIHTAEQGDHFDHKKRSKFGLLRFKQKSVQQTTKSSLPQDSHFKPLSSEEIFCKIMTLGLNIPLEGEIKLRTYSYGQDEDNEQGHSALIQSSSCLPGFYSKVRFNNSGRIKEFIDCRNTSLEKLALNSGFQGEIIDLTSKENRINLALSGPGMFIENCGNEIHYTRDGRFLITTDGTLTSEGGCLILDEVGSPMILDKPSDLKEDGCSSSGQCLAVADPKKEEIKVLDRKKLLAISAPLKTIIKDKIFFMNAYEDQSDPEGGWLGPDFAKLPGFRKPVSCP